MNKDFNLSSNEIKVLSEFINMAINNPITECIYILPNTLISKEEIIEVYLITGKMFYINNKLIFCQTGKECSNEFITINKLINDFNNKNKERLIFYQTFEQDYNINMQSIRDIKIEKELVSSIIIFDRYSSYRKNQDMAKAILKPYLNINKINNINSVLIKTR